MKAFLLIGQSNMAGRGDFGEVPEIINERAFVLRNGRWQPMREPINPDRQVFAEGEFRLHSGVGLSASFADEYAKYFQENVGLIPCADGGTCISEWQPGELLYDHAVAQVKLALRTAQLAGILWHQGEHDSCRMEDVERYRERFLAMINALKRDLLIGDVPLVLGELGSFVPDCPNGSYPFSGEINRVLHGLAGELPHCGIASAHGLSCRFDGIHFNSASYREFGKRYFQEYLKIVKKR